MPLIIYDEEVPQKAIDTINKLMENRNENKNWCKEANKICLKEKILVRKCVGINIYGCCNHCNSPEPK